MVGYNFNKKRRLFKPTRRQYPGSFVSTGDLRNEKTLKIPKIIYLLGLAALTLFTIIYFVFFSSIFQIKDAIVEGNKSASKEQIIAQLPIGKNIFLFDSDQTKNNILKEVPQIKDLQIYLGLPNALKVVVAEREGRIIWQTNNERYFITSEGAVGKKVEQESEIQGYPIVVDKKNIGIEPREALVSPSFVSFIENLNGQFESYTGTKPKYFEIEETTFDVNLYTEAGYYVKFNSLRSSKKQLENLKRVLVAKSGTTMEYIDLRIDGWAYYK